MSDECNLLAAWRSADLGSTLCVYLTDKVTVAAVADDIDVYTLRLSSLTNSVDLAIVAVAQCSVV